MEEIGRIEDVLTNSDWDLIALKATLVHKLGELEAFGPRVESMNTELTRLDAEAQTLASRNVTPAEAMHFVARMAALRRPVSQLNKLTGEVADIAVKSIKAHEVRAATNTKLAEAQGIAAALEVSAASRAIFHALAGDDQNLRDALDDALRRRLYGPRHLELPSELVELEYPVTDAEIAMVKAQQ